MPAGKKTETSRGSAESETLLFVHVVPRSSRPGIKMLEDGTCKVSLTAPPVDGAANKQLVDFLAKLTGLPKSSISILTGTTSRKKRIRIRGIQETEFQAIVRSRQ